MEDYAADMVATHDATLQTLFTAREKERKDRRFLGLSSGLGPGRSTKNAASSSSSKAGRDHNAVNNAVSEESKPRWKKSSISVGADDEIGGRRRYAAGGLDMGLGYAEKTASGMLHSDEEDRKTDAAQAGGGGGGGSALPAATPAAPATSAESEEKIQKVKAKLAKLGVRFGKDTAARSRGTSLGKPGTLGHELQTLGARGGAKREPRRSETVRDSDEEEEEGLLD